MDFFNSAVDVLQTLVIALGAGLGIWGGINLMEGYGNDNPGAFTARLAPYGISQSEFLRQAIRRATIRPVIHVSAVNDELLSAVGKLAAEYGRIGGNLNQIARYLNEYGAPYHALSGEVRAAIADLAALKYEVLQKVGDAVGNTQAYQL